MIYICLSVGGSKFIAFKTFIAKVITYKLIINIKLVSGCSGQILVTKSCVNIFSSVLSPNVRIKVFFISGQVFAPW